MRGEGWARAPFEARAMCSRESSQNKEAVPPPWRSTWTGILP